MPLWRVKAGKHIYKGQKVKAGETFHAPDFDVPAAFRDKIQKVSEDEEFVPEVPDDAPRKSKLVMIRAEGTEKTRFDVINQLTGDKINTKPLKRKEAMALLEQPSDPEDGGADDDPEGDE